MVQSGGVVNADFLTIESAGSYDALAGAVHAHKQVLLNGKLDFASSPFLLDLGANCFADFRAGQILNATAATFTGGPGSVMEFPAGYDPFSAIGHIDTQGIIHVAGQPLTIPADRAVGGTGTIQGNVTNNGTVAPGNSPGAITISGAFAEGSGALLKIEIAGKKPADEFDTLTVTGAATLGGTLDLSLLDGFVPQAGDQFAIISAQSLTGTFANVTGGHIPLSGGGGQFDVLYTPTGVTLTNFQPVPEPATAAILTVCGTVLACQRRRRRAVAP
jgi:hypothetical protein